MSAALETEQKPTSKPSRPVRNTVRNPVRLSGTAGSPKSPLRRVIDVIREASRKRGDRPSATNFTANQLALLLAVKDAPGGSTFRELAMLAGATTFPGVTRDASRLEDAGLVERRPLADARTLTLVVTPAGAALLRRLAAALA